MRKRLLAFMGLLIGLGVLLTAGVAHASSVQTGTDVYYGADLVQDGTLYAAGSTVTVAGTVHGDLFCLGQTVEITGTVDGDVMCAAQQLTLKGRVGGDIRVAAQNVAIDNATTGSATVLGQVVNVSKEATIGRDLTLLAQTATLGGRVGRDLTGSMAKLTISGGVGGHTDVRVDHLLLTETAGLGTLGYTSNNEVQIANGAVVAGTPVRYTPAEAAVARQQSSIATKVWLGLYALAAFMIMGLALMLFRPRLLTGSAERIQREPWAAIGWGCVGLFVPPFAMMLLALTIVGLPLALITAAAWFIVLMLSFVIAGNALGRVLAKMAGLELAKSWQQFLGLGVGLAVLLVASFLPFFGFMVRIVAVIVGIGGLVVMLRDSAVMLQEPAKAKRK